MRYVALAIPLDGFSDARTATGVPLYMCPSGCLVPSSAHEVVQIPVTWSDVFLWLWRKEIEELQEDSICLQV